jgi:hypothetical protein
MGNELVKWQPREIEAGKKMDTALARLQAGEVKTRGGAATPALPSRSCGVVVDLARICAVHGKPYASRYIAGPDGRFQYSQGIRVTESLYLEQYADCLSVARLNSSDLAEECCPWCGGHGFGAVRCGSCRKEICYGKVTGRYFRCRDSCGGGGTMKPQDRMHEGVTPCPPHKGGYGV